MNMNEDVMWQRLKDLQLEAENRRLTQPRVLPAAWRATRLVGVRVWRALTAPRHAFDDRAQA